MKNISTTIFIILISFTYSIKANETSILEIKDNDFVIGDQEAPITIIEYA